MRRLALIIFSAFALLASPAVAKESRPDLWVVSQLSGDARVVRGGFQPASLKVNSALSAGDVVVTGATGRATLARGKDYIVIAPRSELRLPAALQPRGYTRLIQSLGTMLFKVRHTGVPNFTVDTPMLAAVVKGTTFTVVVDKDRSAVQVTEGIVEVTAIDGGMKRLVQGGKTVFIDRADPKRLIDADDRPSGGGSSTTTALKISGSGDASVAAIAGLTGGLVRAEVLPQPAAPTPVAGAPAAPAPTVTAPGESAPTVTTPTVSAPEAPTPTVATPVVSTPTVTTPVVSTPVTTPTVTVPTVTSPTVTVPSLTAPTVTSPTVTVPTVTTPTVTVPTVTAPTVTVPTVTVPTVTVPTVTAPTVTVPPPVTPVIGF